MKESLKIKENFREKYSGRKTKFRIIYGVKNTGLSIEISRRLTIYLIVREGVLIPP